MFLLIIYLKKMNYENAIDNKRSPRDPHTGSEIDKWNDIV